MNNIEFVKNSQVKTNYYSETTSEGLKIFVVNTEGEKTKYNKISIVVNYGGNDREYIDKFSNKNILIPEGTAHLIEHLICNKGKTFKEVKKDMIALNTKINACTSSKYTKFFIEFTGDFTEPLKYLMEMVFGAKITDKQTQKELGIVFSEMDLSPKNESVENLLFKNKYESSTVIGTRKELYKVNANLVNNIYANYYVPNNIAIVINGNILPGEIFPKIEENLKNLNVQKSFKPQRVKQEFEFSKEHIMVGNKNLSKKVDIALKYGNYNNELSLDMNLTFEVFCLLNFYKISEFVNRMKEQELINSPVFWQYNREFNYARFIVSSVDALKIRKEILLYFRESLSKIISKDDFELAKKVMYAENIKSFLKNPVCEVESSFIESRGVFAEVDALSEFTFEKYQKCLKKLLNYKGVYMYYN